MMNVYLCRRYWYFGPLKFKWTYVRKTLSKWSPFKEAELTYSYPCEGCSKCYIPPKPPPWKWWHILLPPKREGMFNLIGPLAQTVYFIPNWPSGSQSTVNGDMFTWNVFSNFHSLSKITKSLCLWCLTTCHITLSYGSCLMTLLLIWGILLSF